MEFDQVTPVDNTFFPLVFFMYHVKVTTCTGLQHTRKLLRTRACVYANAHVRTRTSSQRFTAKRDMKCLLHKRQVDDSSVR